MLIDQKPRPSPTLQKESAEGWAITLKLWAYFRSRSSSSLNPRAYVTAECCNHLPNIARHWITTKWLHINPDNNAHASVYQSADEHEDSRYTRKATCWRRDSSACVHRAESMGQVYDNTEIMHVIDAYLDIQKRYPNDLQSAAKLGNIYVAGHQYEDAINITEKYRSA